MTDHIKNHGQTNQKTKLCDVGNGIKFDGHLLCGMHNKDKNKQQS